MKAILQSCSEDLTPQHECLLVIGDGRGMHDDVAAVMAMGEDVDMATIGRSVKAWPYCRHWFNADGETAIAWAKQIKELGIITHTLGQVDGFDADWDVEQDDYNYERITHQHGRIHGSSAMFATLAGLAMGYNKIILAGCPMDTNGHWYFEPDSPETLGPLWMGVDFAAWLDFAQQPEASFVRSMSGYTALILGKP